MGIMNLYFIKVFQGLDEFLYAKWLENGLGHSRHSAPPPAVTTAGGRPGDKNRQERHSRGDTKPFLKRPPRCSLHRPAPVTAIMVDSLPRAAIGMKKPRPGDME